MVPVQAQLEFSEAGVCLPYGTQLRAAHGGRGLGWSARAMGRPGAGLQTRQAGVQAM
ncbi:hypothetical protein VA602_00310 [Pseudomonas sp. MH2]|uniref:Uncharacterized protein n=1 Tax=Pseudomonas machongensis TaxID=3110229 RepID=A0ABU5V8V2_9PSED|nr:hypothetical protein [Pseudomonas sp. MH2]MEA5669784.1 hypothetical protein [Pseudomonas sp. MH2]